VIAIAVPRFSEPRDVRAGPGKRLKKAQQRLSVTAGPSWVRAFYKSIDLLSSCGLRAVPGQVARANSASDKRYYSYRCFGSDWRGKKKKTPKKKKKRTQNNKHPKKNTGERVVRARPVRVEQLDALVGKQVWQLLNGAGS
jgi:hypothetical protein